jgi:hypothetical protein
MRGARENRLEVADRQVRASALELAGVDARHAGQRERIGRRGQQALGVVHAPGARVVELHAREPLDTDLAAPVDRGEQLVGLAGGPELELVPLP